jgi:hypothetical protein
MSLFHILFPVRTFLAGMSTTGPKLESAFPIWVPSGDEFEMFNFCSVLPIHISSARQSCHPDIFDASTVTLNTTFS